MVTLDTIKLKLPEYAVRNVNYSMLPNQNMAVDKDKQPIPDTEKPIRTKKIHTLGVNMIEVDQRKECIILELSAKCLKSEYHKGISLNTIEQVIHSINGTGIISLDTNDVMDYGELLRADHTTNLKVPEVKPYMNNLYGTTSLNYNYTIDYYNKKHNNGIDIKSLAKSNNTRFIAYNKLMEVQKDKELNKHYSYPQLIDNFGNVLRVEAQFRQFDKIRKYFKTSSINLTDVLSSKEKPNLRYLQTILRNTDQYPIFNTQDFINDFNKFRKHHGDLSIIKSCNYNINNIKNLLQDLKVSKSTLYRTLEEYRILINQHQNQKQPEQNKYIKEIMELLKAA